MTAVARAGMSHAPGATEARAPRNNTRARDIQADVLFDEIHDIADTPRVGVKTVRKGESVETTEADMIEHRRLQIDARKWLLGKLAPKKYGDKSTMEHVGPDGLPMQMEVRYTDADRAKALADFMAKTAKREEK